MFLCTECYIQNNNQTLMLHRTKKEKDVNKGKWVGLGGKLEAGESPEECLLREVREEAGVEIHEYRLRGIITFTTLHRDDDDFYIFLYTADSFTGSIGECDEGELAWIDNDKIAELNLWEGDRYFWEWLFTDKPFFSAKFLYDGDKLVNHAVRFYEGDE